MNRKPERPAIQLDEVSKAIIEQLQQDGRRSYAAIGKVVGPLRGRRRQRVQRLIDSGVMQIVAVTDPLELGFARQAMVGVRVTGPLEPVADQIAELDEVDYVVVDRGRLRPARRGRLRERRAPARADLLPAPRDRGRRRHRDVHVPAACASRPTRGASAEALPATTGSRSGTRPPAAAGRRAPPSPGDLEVDVAVVGAGYTGLWTAYYLAEADPTLRIAVLEAEVAGFGASGRNGGWCSALFPASLPSLAAISDRDGALAQHRAMRGTVDEVARVAAAEGIDAHLAKGGTITLARSRAQWLRAREEVRDGPGVGTRRGRRPAARRPEASAVLARRRDRRRDVHPGLRRAPPRPPGARAGRGGRASRRPDLRAHPRHRRRGRPGPHRARRRSGPGRSCAPPRATPRACRVTRAPWCPVYSLVIATEPLPAETWQQIGLRPPGDLHRPPPPHRLRPAHRRRPDRLRRPRSAVPRGLAGPAGVRPRRARLHRSCTPRCSTCSRCWPAPGSPTRGAARSASRATGAPRSAWTAAPAWPGPAATSATASAPPTSPAGPCAT